MLLFFLLFICSNVPDNMFHLHCYCQYTKMVSNNNDIPDRLSIVDKYVKIAINKLHLLKQVNT